MGMVLVWPVVAGVQNSSSGERVESVNVSIPALVSVDQAGVLVTATVVSGGRPAAGRAVTFRGDHLLFPCGRTAMTDANGVAAITVGVGATPSARLNGSAVTAFLEDGGERVSGDCRFTVVRVNDPTPRKPKILDGHYEDNSIYTVVLIYTVTPVVEGVPVDFSFEPGEGRGVDHPATLEEKDSATNPNGEATVRLRSSDLREAPTVRCTFEASAGSTHVEFEGITGVKTVVK